MSDVPPDKTTRFRHRVDRLYVGGVAIDEGVDEAMRRFGRSRQTIVRMMREAEAARTIEALQADLESVRVGGVDARQARLDAGSVVDAYIQKRIDDKSRSGSSSIWVTSLAAWPECPRKAVFSTTHRAIAKPRDVAGSRTLEAATLQEELLRRVFADQNIFFGADGRQSAVRQPIEPFPLSGKIDFWLPEPDGRLMEMKSAHPNVWPSIQKIRAYDSGGLGFLQKDAPVYMRSYYRQPQIYMWLTDTKGAALVLWNRAQLEAIQFDLEFDEEVVAELQRDLEEMRGYCVLVTDALKDEKELMAPSVLGCLPPPPPLGQDPPCHFCDYSDVCGAEQRWKVTGDVVEHPRLALAVRQEQRLSKWGRMLSDAHDYIKSEFAGFVAANAHDGCDRYTIHLSDGTRISGKRDARGVWRLKKQLPGGQDREDGDG